MIHAISVINIQIAFLKNVLVTVAALSKAWVFGRTLVCIWGFEYRRRHEFLSVVCVVCCQVG